MNRKKHDCRAGSISSEFDLEFIEELRRTAMIDFASGVACGAFAVLIIWWLV